jgi:hypothetical protein
MNLPSSLASASGPRNPGEDDDVDNAGPIVHGLRLLEAAAEYCARGEPVFWLRGKQPLVSRSDGGKGFHDATTDIDELRRVFSRYRGATGIGMVIRAGTFVVDSDPRHGGDESLRALEADHGALPETAEQATGNNGRHLIYSTPVEIRQVAGFRPGLDTRAAGKGYIVVEPSNHPVTGKPYRWVRRCAPAAAPRWLLDLVRVAEVAKQTYSPPTFTGEEHATCACEWCRNGKTKHEPCICEACRRLRHARTKLRGIAKKVAEAAEGERNNLLNWAWHKLAGFRDVLQKADVHSTLLKAAESCGLSEREALKVLR